MAALGDAGLKDKANYVFTAINEAFRTLKDPDSRLRYDQELAAGNIRAADTSLNKAEQARSNDDPENAATNGNSEKFWKLALRDWRDKNYRGCVQNIKFAIQFEPDNEVFKEWLAKAEEADRNDTKKEKNPYKLRLV